MPDKPVGRVEFATICTGRTMVTDEPIDGEVAIALRAQAAIDAARAERNYIETTCPCGRLHVADATELTTRAERAEAEVVQLKQTIEQWSDSADSDANRIEAYQARIATMEAALRPFAEIATKMDSADTPALFQLMWKQSCGSITLITEDLRAARAVLEGLSNAE